MTQADLVKVFTFTPNTSEQDEDLHAVYQAAQLLSLEIYKRLSPQAAQQVISQLIPVIVACRQSIELQPRQQEKKLFTV